MPLAARVPGRALRNDSLSSRVLAVTPVVSEMPWSLLSETVFDPIRRSLPPVHWSPYLFVKVTVLCVNWMLSHWSSRTPMSSVRVMVKPSITSQLSL